MNKDNINNYIHNEKNLLDQEYQLIEQLSIIRKQNNLSQRELCKLINIKQPALVKIEKGDHSPQLNTLLKILNASGYTIEFKKRPNL